MGRLLAALVVTLAGATARAEPLVFVAGATLRSGNIAEILPLPGGELLRATDLIAEFWRSAQDPETALGYDVETRRFRSDVEPYLGAATLDRVQPIHDWFLYDTATGGFLPLGPGPVVPASVTGISGDILKRPGAVLVAAARTEAERDTDADGIPDSLDDCILVADGPTAPGSAGLIQRDTDGDGVGNICDPDLNGDGIVNFGDLSRMKRVFFRTNPDADLNGDGVVNFADLAIMKKGFFKAPGPSGRSR